MLSEWRCPRPRIIAGNKLDLLGAAANFEALREILGPDYVYAGVSALAGTGLAEFASALFAELGVVRFYSKRPGHKADMDVPFVLRRGQTVHDAAARVHRDVAAHLRVARLYRAGDAHGLPVDKHHIVEDGDILEFHA
jgi:uncharacterized protein